MKHVGIQVVDGLDVRSASQDAEERGARVYVLPGPAIIDRSSFFHAVRAVLPLDPPVTTDNWDGLSDSLWEGLYTLDDERITILWPEASVMRRVARADYENAVGVLSHIAKILSDPVPTVGRPKELSILLG